MRFSFMVFYADVYYKALHETWIKLGDEFAEATVPLLPDSDYFIFHFYPPRMALSGTIEFTFCEDSREQLKQLSVAYQGVKPMIYLNNPIRRHKE